MHPYIAGVCVPMQEGSADPNVNDQRERPGENAQAQSPGRQVLRLFIGIPLAAATASDLAAAVHRLRSKAASEILRWSAPESWHITLQFLGSTTLQQYECVTAHLRELRHPSIQIQLGALDTFDRAGSSSSMSPLPQNSSRSNKPSQVPPRPAASHRRCAPTIPTSRSPAGKGRAEEDNCAI